MRSGLGRGLLVALLGWAPEAGLRAQGPTMPQGLYRQAQDALLRGDFADAQATFTEYIDRYPASPAHGAALLGAAKAAVYAGDFSAAARHADLYLKLHGSGGGRSLAHLYLGHAHLARRQLDLALRAYHSGYRATDDREVRFAIQTVVERVAGLAPMDAAQGLLDLELAPELTAALYGAVAGRLELAGKKHQAALVYLRLADRMPDSEAGMAAHARHEQLKRMLAETARIGVLVPLSGPLAAYGRELEEGIRIAADQFADSTRRTVQLLVEDTEGNAIVATRACQELLEQEPVAIIGPLTSVSAIGCAATTAPRQIPHVVPAASETGLPSIGEAVVCLSPSLSVYGRALGNYAVEGLGLCSHLIIAPNDAFGVEIAAEYRRAVEAAGGTVWQETFYEPGTTDFGPHLRSFKASFLDTLKDSSWYLAPDSTRLNREEVTVYPDAVFTPGYAADLILLLPQVRFYKIAGRLLGTDSYADEEVLMRTGGNLEDAIFASVQPLAAGVLEWETFSSRYALRYGRPPGRMAALGYDSFRLLARGLAEADPTPESVARFIRSENEFRGASGTMRFNRRGENTSVPIYYIRDRKISPAVR